MRGPSDPAPGIEIPGDPSPAPELSVVIPAYNEESRIVPTLRSIAAYLRRTGARAEILVVDDGSADGTRLRVEALSREVPDLKILSNPGNRGKGFSVRRGFLESRGEMVLITDADLSTPIEELERLAEPLRRGEAEIAVGSRALDPSKVEVPQGRLRQTMGKIFNRAVRLLTGLPIRDTQCGFKLLRRRPFLPIFEATRVDRFSYDVEILYLARRRGLRIAEVPVLWRNSPQSRVGILSAPLQMLTDVVRIVLRERTGGYRRKA